MNFVPPSSVIGAAAIPARTIEHTGTGKLPAGTYTFEDYHCTDPGCDCRKTIVCVYHGRTHVSTLDYGWEGPAYYRRWMHRSARPDTMADEMSGPSVDFASPNRVDPREMLELFEEMLDPEWIGNFKSNYAAVKAATGAPPPPRATRFRRPNKMKRLKRPKG